MLSINDSLTSHSQRRTSGGHISRSSIAVRSAPLPGLLPGSSAAASGRTVKRKSASGSAHPASRPRHASDPLPFHPSQAAFALPRQSGGLPTSLHPLQRMLYSSGARLPWQADPGASGSSERNEDEGLSDSDDVTDSEDSDAWIDDEMLDGAELGGGLRCALDRVQRSSRTAFTRSDLAPLNRTSLDDTRLTHLSRSFLHSLKRGPFSTEPEQDYHAFAEVHSSALDKSNKLLDFTAVEVPGAMLGKINEMQQRIHKSLAILDHEKDKLVGREAQARQERAGQLIAHIAAFTREIVKNRQATKAEFEAIRAETIAKLTSLRAMYESDAQKMQQKLKQVSKPSSLVQGNGGGEGGGGKRR